MEPLLKGLLRSLGGSEVNFLEVCFGRIPSGNIHTKATSKKSRPPSGKFRPNPPELPRSPSRSFSCHEADWKIILTWRTLRIFSILVRFAAGKREEGLDLGVIQGGGGGEGAQAPRGCLQRVGGAKYFLSGLKFPPREKSRRP